MTESTLAHRIFIAHLELSYRLGRKVTLAEFGELVAKAMGREVPFTPAAVSRWENGSQVPTAAVIEAIAAVTHTDPGWISHGEKSAAPGPRSHSLTDETPQRRATDHPLRRATDHPRRRATDFDLPELSTAESSAPLPNPPHQSGQPNSGQPTSEKPGSAQPGAGHAPPALTPKVERRRRT